MEIIYVESNRFVVDFPVSFIVSNKSENVTKSSTLSLYPSMSEPNVPPFGSFPSSPELSVPVVGVPSIPVPFEPRVQALDHHSEKLSSPQIRNNSAVVLMSEILEPLITGFHDRLIIEELFNDQWKT